MEHLRALQPRDRRADEVRAKLASRNGTILRTITFKDYYETMAFVNAVAWIAHQHDHHPDMEVHYNKW